MPRIDHHAAVSVLRARYNVSRRLLERQETQSPLYAQLQALDALQSCLESLSPSTLSCTAWQSLALIAFNTAFAEAPREARQLYAGGLLVFCHSTGITWDGDWKNELLDAA